jgi:hypothetical protein
MGPGRFELPTSRLSGVRSHQLSYEPDYISRVRLETVVVQTSRLSRLNHHIHLYKEQKKMPLLLRVSDISCKFESYIHSPLSSQVKNFSFLRIIFNPFIVPFHLPDFSCQACRTYSNFFGTPQDVSLSFHTLTVLPITIEKQ